MNKVNTYESIEKNDCSRWTAEMDESRLNPHYEKQLFGIGNGRSIVICNEKNLTKTKKAWRFYGEILGGFKGICLADQNIKTNSRNIIYHEPGVYDPEYSEEVNTKSDEISKVENFSILLYIDNIQITDINGRITSGLMLNDIFRIDVIEMIEGTYKINLYTPADITNKRIYKIKDKDLNDYSFNNTNDEDRILIDIMNKLSQKIEENELTNYSIKIRPENSNESGVVLEKIYEIVKKVSNIVSNIQFSYKETIYSNDEENIPVDVKE